MALPVTPELLLKAYAAGLFPMAEAADDDSLHWIEPEWRGIFPLEQFHVPRSLAKLVRRKPFEIRVNTAFEAVIRRCGEETAGRPSTWINAPIRALYGELHRRGNAHSVECWLDGELVGGLYGVHLGAAFCGESMFSRVSGASKVALVHLVARLKAGGFRLLDAQFVNPHLVQFGCVEIAQADYLARLAEALAEWGDFAAFNGDGDPETVLRIASARG